MFGTGPGSPLLLVFSVAIVGATQPIHSGPRFPSPSSEPKSRAKLRLARAVESQHPLSSLVQTTKTVEGTADQGHPLVGSGATSEQPFCLQGPLSDRFTASSSNAGTVETGDLTQAVLTAV